MIGYTCLFIVAIVIDPEWTVVVSVDSVILTILVRGLHVDCGMALRGACGDHFLD